MGTVVNRALPSWHRIKGSLEISLAVPLTAVFQDYQVGQSCKMLLLALCENLRFGSKESVELLAQLRSQLGYHDLGMIHTL